MSQPTQPQPFTRLADVEVQLVMQRLDMKERLALARCSRQLLHAASHPFAWQHSSLLGLNSTALFPRPSPGKWGDSDTHAAAAASALPAAPTRRHSLQHGLLRFQPVMLIWHKHAASAGVAQVLAAVPSMQGFRLGVPDALSTAQWKALLAHPVAQQLRIIDIDDTSIPDATLARVLQLPYLHTLACRPELDTPASLLEWLPRASSLTDLTCDAVFTSSNPHSTLCHAIARCTRLRRLTLLQPRFVGGGLRSLLTALAAYNTLEYLALTGLAMQSAQGAHVVMPTEEFEDAFLPLTRLTSARLSTDSTYHHSALLSELARAPHLTQLDVHTVTLFDPSIESIQRVLRSSPQLRVELAFMEPHTSCYGLDPADGDIAAVQAWWDGLSVCSPRLQVKPCRFFDRFATDCGGYSYV